MKNERGFLAKAIKKSSIPTLFFSLFLGLWGGILASFFMGTPIQAASLAWERTCLAGSGLCSAQLLKRKLEATLTSASWRNQQIRSQLKEQNELFLNTKVGSATAAAAKSFPGKTKRLTLSGQEEKASELLPWQQKIIQLLGQISATSEQEALQQAVALLENLWHELPVSEKISASACLAYFYHRLKRQEKEYHWLSLHWEKYRSSFWNFSFLPPAWSKALVDYLNYWEKNYPQLFDLAFIKPAQPLLEKWPASLTLAAVIRSEAFYKIFQGESPVSGGRLKAGTNLIEIPLPAFSPGNKSIKYILELKKADLIIRYQLELLQDLTTQVVSAPEKAQQSGAVRVENRARQLQVFLYWQDKLLAQSQIIQDLKENINQDLPPRDGVFRPFGPYQEKTNPQNFGVPVFQALQLLGDYLWKKLRSDQSLGKGQSGESQRTFSLTHLTPEKIRTLNFSFHSLVDQGQTRLYQGSLRLQVSFQEGTAFWRK